MSDIGKSPIGGLRVTKNETIHDLAVTLFDRVTTSLNLKTSGPGSDFPDDIVLTGSPDDMIFNGKLTYTLIHSCINSFM